AEGQKQFEEWKQAVKPVIHTGGWTSPTPVVQKASAAQAVLEPDGSVLFKGPARKGATARIELPASGWVAAVRLLAMPPSSRDSRGVDGKGKRTTIQLSAAVRKNGQAGETRVPFYYADAEKKEPRFVNGHEVIGVVNGWTLSTQHPNENQTSI